MFRYKREILFSSILVVLCIGLIFGITKIMGTKTFAMEDSTTDILEATTKETTTTTTSPLIITDTYNAEDDEDEIDEDTTKKVTVSKIPYAVAPTIVDDGSIIFDGKTITELTNQLNKSLKGYLTNTGYFYADYSRRTGIDPYLAVAITLLETGCNAKSCSSLAVNHNNLGGLKGAHGWVHYDTLEEGINGYLNTIYKRYYLKGMTTAETMASTYAASSQWCNKVNARMAEIKSR